MKGLSGKRKISFLGRGSNVAFVEIFIKPIYIDIGGEIFHFYFTLAFHPLHFTYLDGFWGATRLGHLGQSVFPWSSKPVIVITDLNNFASTNDQSFLK